MKKMRLLFLFAAVMLMQSNLIAQQVLVVEPGVGTLNAAIKAHGGDRIYQLKAGEWYQIDAIIEHEGYHLQIIGEVPKDGGMPATLQNNATAEGVVFAFMFDAKGDITIKNIYLVNCDLTGTRPNFLMRIAAATPGLRGVVDNCVIKPVSNNNAFMLQSPDVKFYYTNNIAISMGHMLNPNDGHYFVTNTHDHDTLYVENNTFVATGTNMHMGNFAGRHHNYTRFNHNTFVMHKSQIDWAVFENEYYWSNNLMFDVQTQPWAWAWNSMPGNDPGWHRPAMIYADTIKYEDIGGQSYQETLPSERLQYVMFNAHYRNPGFKALTDSLNRERLRHDPPKNYMYHMDLIWPEDSVNVSRETNMFFNEEAFPKFLFNYYWKEIDPEFEYAAIYEHSDMFVEWTYPATMIHGQGFPSDQFPPPAQWPQYHYNPDEEWAVNEAWPVFNAVYKNAELLTASNFGLPLGDLNWFPDKKAIWEQNKVALDNQMREGNPGRIDFTSVEEPRLPQPTRLTAQVFPNPANNTIRLPQEADMVHIYSMTGSRMMTLTNATVIDVAELPIGLYIISLKKGEQVATGKFVISR